MLTTLAMQKCPENCTSNDQFFYICVAPVWHMLYYLSKYKVQTERGKLFAVIFSLIYYCHLDMYLDAAESFCLHAFQSKKDYT